MAVRKSHLAPQRMSNRALYQRARTVIRWMRWENNAGWVEREHYLDELDEILLELQMRGEQLRLC